MAVAVLAGCGNGSTEVDAGASAASRQYAIDHLVARASAGFRGRPVYQAATELLPNVKFQVDGGAPEPLAEAVVVGEITDAAPGRSQVLFGEDEPDLAMVEFENPRAIARTVHLTVAVDERIGPTEVGDSVGVGLAIDANVDPELIMEGLETLGTVLLFLRDGGPVFEYDPSLYSIMENGGFILTVGPGGELAFPLSGRGEASLTAEERAMFAGLTLADLRDAADAPERVIPISMAGGIPSR